MDCEPGAGLPGYSIGIGGGKICQDVSSGFPQPGGEREQDARVEPHTEQKKGCNYVLFIPPTPESLGT